MPNNYRDLEDAVADYEKLGCQRCDQVLGFGKLPDGYALMVDADEAYFFWLNKDAEGPCDWNKWRVRRNAILRSQKAPTHDR